MNWYPDRISDWFSSVLSGYTWHGNRDDKVVYLSFDDGPTPVVTDFVIEQLKRYDFKATFFCIGDCVQRHPDIYKKLIDAGHAVGNHTHHHLNNWKNNTKDYIADIDKASQWIDSTLFRPPYGKITPATTRRLKNKGFTIVMWDVLSGDFDSSRTAQSCLDNLLNNTKNGSIIVFHDSEKAYKKLQVILPEYLGFLKSEEFKAMAMTQNAPTS